MIDIKKFHEFLNVEGVKFMAGVPDSHLNDFCLYAASELSSEKHVIAANEGNAVALAAGNYFATGNVPLVYMQNSGLGNAINPLLSLTNKEVYSIPLVLLIGWRGDPEVKDHAHHKLQGELTPVLLEAMGIPYKVIDSDGEDAFNVTKWAIEKAKDISSPTALIVKKGMLAKTKEKIGVLKDPKLEMSREMAIKTVINSVPSNSIFIATTGRATREIYEVRENNGQGHEKDFLNIGAMGHGSSIATGIALAAKDRTVVCLDGDAAVLMHLGALTTHGKIKPKNLLHVILNNGLHESVGGQPSAGFTTNLTAIAENAGYDTIGKEVDTEKDLKDALKILMEKEAPTVIDVHICQGIRNDIPSLNVTFTESKEELMRELNS
jgi:phosphonopyruvate decarboxylase